MAVFEFPGHKRFAFTVIDDTDVATVANVKPIYELLDRLGMRATKTVWPVGCPEGSKNYSSSETLEDEHYVEFIRDLQRREFEITWHGATMETSTRERIAAALNRFFTVCGHYPHIHANHAFNRDNLYWGMDRIDQPLIRFVYAQVLGLPWDYFGGHRSASPYWWGDLSEHHIKYGRNLTFRDINTARMNPSMPYRDPRRPCVSWWFSATDAEDADAFIRLLQHKNQERLESERGFCVVATHFGKGFVRNGKVHPLVQERLESLARRPGWFPTVGQLLDWLLVRRRCEHLPRWEWQRMQWRWAVDLLVCRLLKYQSRFFHLRGSP